MGFQTIITSNYCPLFYGDIRQLFRTFKREVRRIIFHWLSFPPKLVSIIEKLRKYFTPTKPLNLLYWKSNHARIDSLFFFFWGEYWSQYSRPPKWNKRQKEKKKMKVLSYHNPGWLAFQTTLNILEGQMRER